METIEFKDAAYASPIVPFHGNEYFYIGMPLEVLNKLLWTHYSVYGEQQNDGFCLLYNILLDKSIRISIDILKKQVYRIEFLRDYKGSFDNIKIGSTIKELCDLRGDVFFDEEFILVGKFPYDYIIKINNLGNTIYSLDEVMNNYITSIIVENKDVLR